MKNEAPTQESRLTLKPGYRFSRMRLCPGRASELRLAEDSEITSADGGCSAGRKPAVSRELGTK